MSPWLINIITYGAIAILSFLLGLLGRRIFEKRVKLIHEFSSESKFGDEIFFQNLLVVNNGNKTASNVCVNLKREVKDIQHKIKTDEDYSEELIADQGIFRIKFEKLLPKDKITISFMSKSKRSPKNPLISIKSDEVKSVPIERSSDSNMWANVAAIGALVGGVSFVIWFTFSLLGLLEKNYIDITLYTDKTMVKKGENARITYKLHNKSKSDVLDLTVLLDVPGVTLKLGESIFGIKIFKSGEKIVNTVGFSVPQLSPGNYTIKMSVGYQNQAGKIHTQSKKIKYTVIE